MGAFVETRAKALREGTSQPAMAAKATFAAEQGEETLAVKMAALSAADLVELAEQGTLAWVSPLVKDPDATKAVLAMDTASPALQRHVEANMELKDCRTDLRAVAVRDYHISTLWFIQEQKLSPMEASATFQLCSLLLENLKEKRLSLTENQKFFADTMAAHGAEEDQLSQADEPDKVKGRLKDFQPGTIKSLAEFVGRGLFQHYRMHMYLFFAERPQSRQDIQLDISIPAACKPLDEGRSKSERLQLEADAKLAGVSLPTVPTELATEEAEEITVKCIERILVENSKAKDVEITDAVSEQLQTLSKTIAASMVLTAEEPAKK